jgi:uncharacterized membrane protein/mono/diheme cytochrome c family protein
MIETIGHFHVVLVHLPIGILLLACLFAWLERHAAFQGLQQGTSIALLIGMIAAICSAVTGYCLSLEGDYPGDLVAAHQWFGISVAVFSIVLYAVHKRKTGGWSTRIISLLVVLLISIAGHLGGTLTHGQGYLFGTAVDTSQGPIRRKPIKNVQQAIAYSDVIQPILQARCYSCHGPRKQKGKLRMDDSLRLMKGGKDGPVIVPGNEAKSELIKRISLPKDDDDHMPPSGKTQLNAQDLALIHWWVATGATFNSPVGALPQSAEIRATLSDLEKVPVVIQRAPIIPTVSVIAADPAAIEKLKAKGVIIQPVAQHTNFLLADFVMANVTDRDLALLLPLKDQLIELRLGNTSIGDGGLAFVGQLQQLWRLELQHTRITDKGLAEIKKLAELRYLNLVGTSISADGLLSLAGLSHLQSIYLYQTSVKRVDWQRLKKQFSKTNIDTGGYSVPLFPTDTMEIKPPPAIK